MENAALEMKSWKLISQVSHEILILYPSVLPSFLSLFIPLTFVLVMIQIIKKQLITRLISICISYFATFKQYILTTYQQDAKQYA